MGEVSKQQILDLLYEVLASFDRIDAKLDENLALVRTINYELELGRKQRAEARSKYSGKVSPP